MAARSMAYMGSWAPGFLLGVVLSLVNLVLLLEASDISDQMLLGAFTIVVFLVSASLTNSVKRGLVLAVSAVVGQVVAEIYFVYFGHFVSVFNPDLSLLPYAFGFALFAGRIPLFPLAGAAGGYVAHTYFSDRKSREKDRKRKPRRR